MTYVAFSRIHYPVFQFVKRRCRPNFHPSRRGAPRPHRRGSAGGAARRARPHTAGGRVTHRVVVTGIRSGITYFVLCRLSNQRQRSRARAARTRRCGVCVKSRVTDTPRENPHTRKPQHRIILELKSGPKINSNSRDPGAPRSVGQVVFTEGEADHPRSGRGPPCHSYRAQCNPF